MQRITAFAPLVLLAILLITPANLGAQSGSGEEHPRQGMWGGFGFGAGSAGCSGSLCDSGRVWGFSGYFRLGGTLSPKLRWAVGTSWWFKPDGPDYFVAGTLTLQGQYYPATDLLLLLGAGWAYTDQDAGLGLELGVGYDIGLGASKALALTPFVNWVYIANDQSANYLQVGLGLGFN